MLNLDNVIIFSKVTACFANYDFLPLLGPNFLKSKWSGVIFKE